MTAETAPIEGPPHDIEGPHDGAKPRARTDWPRELRGLVLALAAVFAFQTLFAKQFYIPSISMMPNLMVGDRLIVSKYPYGWNWSSAIFHIAPRGTWRVGGAVPQYGDIVVVVPRNRSEDLIKRVVARPGDRIAVVNGRIVLNGRPVPQSVEPPVQIAADDQLTCEGALGPGTCYAELSQYSTRLPSGREVYELPTYRETLPNGATYRIVDHLDQTLDHMAEITVPPGHVFLMGDNRDHSADSRAPLWENGLGGPVPLSDIAGRAEFVTWSWDGSESWNPLTWWSALRHERAWQSLRPPLMRPAATPAQASTASGNPR